MKGAQIRLHSGVPARVAAGYREAAGMYRDVVHSLLSSRDMMSATALEAS